MILTVLFRQKKLVTTIQFNWTLSVAVSKHLIIIERASVEEHFEAYHETLTIYLSE